MRVLGPVAALLLGACAAAPIARAPAPVLDGPMASRSTPDEAFRALPPAAAPAKPLALPAIQTHTLKNGVRVMFVERHETPLLSVAVVSDRGSDQADPGIAQYWSRVALRASEKWGWWDVSEAWNDFGAEFGAVALHDASVVNIEVMSKLADASVMLLGDLVAHPVFPERARELAAQRMHADLQTKYSRPSGQLDLAVYRHFYPPGHLYREVYSPPENIDKVTGGLVHAYHEHTFTPAHVTVVGSGDLTTQAFFQLCDRAFAELKGPALGPQPPPKVPADVPAEPRFIVIDRSGATQAQISFAWLGPTRFIEDQTACRLAGDDFEDSLHARIRTEKGLTYGAHTSSAAGRGRLPHEVRTAVETANVGEVVRDAFAILGARATTPRTDAELALVRASAGTAAPYFDANDDTLAALSTIAIYALPLDYWAKRADRIAAVDASALRLAYERYLPLDKVRVFVVGDASKILPQLEKLSLGRVDVRPAVPTPKVPKKS